MARLRRVRPRRPSFTRVRARLAAAARSPWWRSPFFVTVVIVMLVGSGIVGLRTAGSLESMELAAYDWYVRMQPVAPPDPRILMVTITERDIQAQGKWPLPDAVLARALTTLARGEPRAIGIDLYRDIPVPPGTEELNAVLAGDSRIYGVMKFKSVTSVGVAPPPALKGTERIGFSDLLVDPGGTVRRGLLYLDDGTTSSTSLALLLSLAYLKPHGVALGPDPTDERQIRLGRTTIRALEGNEGGYVRADAGGYQFLLDWRHGRSIPQSVSLTELLSGGVAPRLVKDRVVLLGVTADSVKDQFYTPFSRGGHEDYDISGMAIHAEIVSQLLRIGLEHEAPTATLRKWQETLWIFLWCAIGGLIAHAVRSPTGLSVLLGAALVTLGFIDYVALRSGWWIPLVPPAIAAGTAMALETGYRSYREAKERADLMRLFSRQVSKEVAQSLWQRRHQFLKDGRLQSQSMVVTALFTDLTGFTTVSERLGPEGIMDWLNEYMDAMAQQASLHGGVIAQYSGDAIVVIFGSPVARTTDAEIAEDAVRAVRCALAMEVTLRGLNARWKAEHRPVTGMRVGIFTGPVVSGTVGSAERSEYIVVGDTMNTASRLESSYKELHAPDPVVSPCRIFIGAPTQQLIGDQFETEAVGEVSLKGKEQPVGVYRVLR